MNVVVYIIFHTYIYIAYIKDTHGLKIRIYAQKKNKCQIKTYI